MEFFDKTEAVKLRSRLGKYLIADDDRETVKQSSDGSTRRAKWEVELIEWKSQVIRLKSCHGKYLTASDIPFLLGMSGKKVTQTSPDKESELRIQWEPIREGFQVKIRSWCGKFLRANGGTPPWRNSITHDDHMSNSTRNWILWDVEAAEITESELISDYLSSLSSFSFSSSMADSLSGSEPSSPMSIVPFSNRRLSLFSRISSRLSTKQSIRAISPSISTMFRAGMELFHNAKAVRLKCHHNKYLVAGEDEESVSQERNGSSKNARWVVEVVPTFETIIRFKSSYGKYLTASNQPFLLGMTGSKVTQTKPRKLDSSVEWEPIREGNQVKLKTRYGNFLRANGGLPPWRNSVTHDIPSRTVTQDWVLWDVEIVEIEVKSPISKTLETPFAHSDSMCSESSSPSSFSIKSESFSRQESSDSQVSSPPKSEGRTIYYHFADENGDVEDENLEGYALTFKGNGVEELRRKLEDETGLEGIILCSRSPLDKKLYPLRLQLPPNNSTIRIVVIQSSSKVARDIGTPL